MGDEVMSAGGARSSHVSRDRFGAASSRLGAKRCKVGWAEPQDCDAVRESMAADPFSGAFMCSGCLGQARADRIKLVF